MSWCNAVTTVNIQSGCLAKVEEKKTLNLYTNKTSQLIKKNKKQKHPLFIFVEENQFSQYNCTSV